MPETTKQPATTQSEPKGSSRKNRRWLRGGFFLLLTLAILFAALPYLLASWFLRDQVLNSALNVRNSTVSSDSASFGWFSPLQIDGLWIQSPQQRLAIRIDRLTAEQPWWQLYAAPETLGHFSIVEPRIEFDLNWDQFGGYSTPEIPELSASVRDAGVTVNLQQLADPVIDIGGLDLDVRIDREPDGRWLAVESGTVFSDRHLTPEMCHQLLQLMDPLLGDVVQVEGAFSLQVDRLRVPLDVSPQQQREQIDFAGRLILHEVKTGVKTPLLKGIVRVAADLYDKRPDEVVRVVNQGEVDIHVERGRVYHQGLEFGLPDISPDLTVRSQGSVGLDESLDLSVTVPKVFLGETVAETEPQQLVQLHLTGTLSDPTITELDPDDTQKMETTRDSQATSQPDSEPAAASADSDTDIDRNIAGSSTAATDKLANE